MDFKMNKIPDWMSELYICVLHFGVPTKQLMPYRRLDVKKWSFMSIQKKTSAFKKYPDVQNFIDELQNADNTNDPDIDF